MADERQKEQGAAERESSKYESSDSGIVSPEKNKILEQHFKDHPEGDPAVRRINPDRGTIPVEEVHDDGTMTVREKPEKTPEKKDEEEPKKAG